MSSENPYAPPGTESDLPIRELRTEGVWLRRVLSLQLLVVFVGLVAAFLINTETIVASGVVLGVVGLALSLLSWRCEDLGFVAYGLAGPMFSLFVFLLIFFNDWSPWEARMPVLTLGIVYLICLLLGAVWLLYRRRENLVQKKS
ncbi:MAG: hypothetical protein CMM01_15540 [Rhodopirellula sp.]|nr:hypothetical protein [Rhodopirellula sp.]